MRGKRWIVATSAALAVFASSFGLAASLGGISGGQLGADDAVVAACDTNGVSASYSTAYSASGTAGYKVGSVTVGDIADACNAQTMRVALTGTSNATLGEQTTTVAVSAAAADTSDTLNFAANGVLAESVTGVHIVIGD